MHYTNCLGENQMVDVLEAGRGNVSQKLELLNKKSLIPRPSQILELISNNSQSLDFSQLSQDGLHFLGSIRGVLPIGPNGVPAFNTLQPSPFDNPKIVAAMTSYNYTLDHQGLTSNVSCRYETETPVTVSGIPGVTGPVMQYSANCTELEGAEVLTNVEEFTSVTGRNALIYWACQSAPGSQTQSYSIYLSGIYGNYSQNLGNISCTVSPIQTALFPVKYQSTRDTFSAMQPNATSPITFSDLITYALVGLGDVISEGQNFQSNLVAESIVTFGVKSFNLAPYQLNDTYLRLCEKMIQGILEYQVCAINNSSLHSFCWRLFHRLLTFDWYTRRSPIGRLLALVQWPGHWHTGYSVGSWRAPTLGFCCQWRLSTWLLWSPSFWPWRSRRSMAINTSLPIQDQSRSKLALTTKRSYLMNGRRKLHINPQRCAI